ncbi:hypothetical protein MHBO_002558 [Bonamia ostreae]|uniref:Phosphatidylserine decarboxylase n=1 Tax=Bonamia ostreae TaxID=126728 RepID=A0ABV2AMQ8_9EUKA
MKFKKGQVHGEFRFGGSTILLLFEKGRVELDDDLLKKTMVDDPMEVYLRMGTRIGEAIL